MNPDRSTSESAAVILMILASAAVLLVLAVRSLSSALSDRISILMLTAMLLVCGSLFLILRYRMNRKLLFLIPILFAALMVRLSMFDHQSGDYISFLSLWTEEMRGLSIRQALSSPIGDYNMPYLYLLLLISRLPVYDLYLIKFISISADVLLALGVLAVCDEIQSSERVSLIAFTAALFAPTVLFNSAYWGQCDGIYAALAVWSVYHILRHRPKLGILLYAFSFSFKLQAVFLLPLYGVLLSDRRLLRWRDLLLFPAGFVGMSLPALLGGRSFSDTFLIYVNQTSAYPYLSLNAPSLWCLIPNEYFTELSLTPVLLALFGTVFLTVWIILDGRKSPAAVLDAAMLFCLFVPWMLPRMHERYFYLAEIFSILYFAVHPGRFFSAICILFGGFLIYCPYMFGQMPVLSFQYVSIGYGLLLLYLIIRYFYPGFSLSGGINHGN